MFWFGTLVGGLFLIPVTFTKNLLTLLSLDRFFICSLRFNFWLLLRLSLSMILSARFFCILTILAVLLSTLFINVGFFALFARATAWVVFIDATLAAL